MSNDSIVHSIYHGIVQWRTVHVVDLSKKSRSNFKVRHDHSPPLNSLPRKAIPPPPRRPVLPCAPPAPSVVAVYLPAPQVVITNFVPPEEVSSVERRAQWNEEASAWLIPRLELAGNSLLRMRRPVSAVGLPRPETEYARHRKGYDSNPRCVCGGRAQLGLRRGMPRSCICART